MFTAHAAQGGGPGGPIGMEELLLHVFEEGEEYDDAIAIILGALAAGVAPQLKTLDLGLYEPDNALLLLASALAAGALPQLEALRLESWSLQGQPRPLVVLMESLKHAPRMRDLRLTG